jgi:carbonic anhydrase/acetyltransferase-like protein (isoleucine patch superfamily)
MIRTYRGAKPRIDKTAFVHPASEVIGAVTIGPEASVWPGAVLRADVDAIRIGRGSNLQDMVVVHCRPGRPTVVGKNVTVGHRAILHGTVVGDGCLIGMGAVVMEADLGRECMVGAGAVVPPGLKVPARSLVLGVPGRIVRKLTPAELKHIRDGEIEYRTKLRPGHRDTSVPCS